MLGLPCRTGFLVAVSRGYFLMVVRGLLIVEASLATEHGPWSTDPIVVAHGLCRRRKWQPTPAFVPREWTEEPGGLLSVGSHRDGHD